MNNNIPMTNAELLISIYGHSDIGEITKGGDDENSLDQDIPCPVEEAFNKAAGREIPKIRSLAPADTDARPLVFRDRLPDFQEDGPFTATEFFQAVKHDMASTFFRPVDALTAKTLTLDEDNTLMERFEDLGEVLSRLKKFAQKRNRLAVAALVQKLIVEEATL